MEAAGLRISLMLPVENRCPASKLLDLGEFLGVALDPTVVESATINILCDLQKDHEGKHKSEAPVYEWESA